ncbi:hypothetical protein BYT27DRAFT_7188203 [Phlegmacium glaucopus]|nr:hypothetical protein BYT27DRAFT_7188203 [Phlegmacium glaucopus]
MYLRLQEHGGTVLDIDIGCDTLLVDALYDDKETLQIAYNTDDNPRLRRVFVEKPSFVQRCIRNNQFVHRIPAQKGMGGTVGKGRRRFTYDDDKNLCHYLARLIPDKAAGGRQGLGVYNELVKMAKLKDTHTWGARHTAESWKERYKKRIADFDERIEDIVKLEGRSRKQLWHEDRRVGHKARLARQKHETEEDSSEGSYGEEESPQSLRKRRRSDYSPPPPNRRRFVQRSGDQQVGTRSRSSRKGKARALEEDADDLDQSDDYMDQDEISQPGPSRSRRSPEATYVADGVLTHHTQPNTASFFTQETTVVTAPSGKSAQSKEASPLSDEPPESSPLVRRPIQVIREPQQASSSENEPIAFLDLTSPSGSIDRNSSVVQLSPSRTLVNPQRQEARPSTHIRPLKAARRPRAVTKAAIVDAPYKNTRFRSQSVEPSIPNSLVRTSKKRRNKEIRETRPSLPTVDEIQDDGRQDNENLEVTDEPMPPPLGDILADEQDVEKMLMSDDFNQDEEIDDVDNARGVSLDTDDAQTEQNLRPTQPPRQLFSSLRMHPSDILREFQESSATRMGRYSVPLTTRPHISNKPAVPVRNTRQEPGSIPLPSTSRNLPDTYKVVEPPRTPLPRPRKNSASSTDSFPVSGTRASALKKKLQQQEKRSLYQPPSGTRAAKFARSRR